MPVSEAVLAHRRGEYTRAVDLMKPILDGMYRLGGSHAQQDVPAQVFLDSAIKANRGDDVRLILARVTARYPHESGGGPKRTFRPTAPMYAF
jgi:hypothetical protein